jgi:hypothetical protein
MDVVMIGKARLTDDKGRDWEVVASYSDKFRFEGAHVLLKGKHIIEMKRADVERYLGSIDYMEFVWTREEEEIFCSDR